MSAVGTLLAAVIGLELALPATISGGNGAVVASRMMRQVLAMRRAIPELVCAALFVIVAGLGPFSGTMALALHTNGVVGPLSPRPSRSCRRDRPIRCTPPASDVPRVSFMPRCAVRVVCALSVGGRH